ncbi:recombinase family protein [Fictibacillus fluitans]|uniref:Recombinase family protein n=1 Tax=Fictibacillus fluitans TaxID=3058422 RepID=A0ABT8HXK8_9BACL|nr:recombinase family protein [Fictibacillus sp. NE201]MDN4525504.1 recombinase family protein [Fictibacillus sp. NE201]
MKKKRKLQTVDEIISSAKNIGFYGRVSTKEQREKNEELPQQIGKVDEFLGKYKKSVSDDYRYRDTMSAYSRSYMERDQLSKLLIAAEKKELDAIIISDRDRLSRQTEEHFEIREMLNKLGIPIIIASRGELYNSEDFIKNLVEDALTKMESDNISARTRAALKSLLSKEQYIGGRSPYGFKKVKDQDGKVTKFIPIPGQINKVKIIFSLYKKGETCSSIAKYLSGKKTKWSASRVRDIIINPIYTGCFVYNRYCYESNKKQFAPIDEWKWFKCKGIPLEEIISLDDWWYCWNKFMKTRDLSPRYLSTSFYLNDIIKCQCGNEMRGKDQRTQINDVDKPSYGSRYYICRNKGCKQKVSADKLHKFIMEWIFRLEAPIENAVQEVKDMLISDMKSMEIRIAELKEWIRCEQKNLELLKRFENNATKEDFILSSSQNDEMLAYLLSKSDSEQKLNQFQKEIMEKQALYDRLSAIMLQENEIRNRMTRYFSPGNWEERSHIDNRNLVLLLVEECRVMDVGTVNIKLKSFHHKLYKESPKSR